MRAFRLRVSLFRWRWLFLSAGLIMAVGCSVFTGAYNYTDGPEYKPVENLPEGRGVVYLYRPPGVMAGGLGAATYYIGRILPPAEAAEEWKSAKVQAILYDEGWVEFHEKGLNSRYQHSLYRSYRDQKKTFPNGTLFFYGVGDSVLGMWIPYGAERRSFQMDPGITKAYEAGWPVVTDVQPVNLKKSGCYFPYFANAGEIICWSDDYGHKAVRSTVGPGDSRYVKISPLVFSFVDQDVYGDEIVKCRLIGAEK
jgi:hypothetical protein